MARTFSVGIPLLGNTLWPTGTTYVKSLAITAATLPERERPQLFLIVTDSTLQDFHLYEPFVSLFRGVIYYGENPTAAEAILGPHIIHCPSRDKLFKQIDRYFPVVPSRKALTHTLSFHYCPEDEWYKENPQEVQQKYELPNDFIFCYNPFWIQEGHLQLFKALALLKQNGQHVHLVCEGFTDNPRYPQYIENFRQYLKKLTIEDLVHILGPLPEIDRIQLIRHSFFVMQPGNFEGLPVFVRQCQALGKTIVRSDLDLLHGLDYGIVAKNCEPSYLATKITELLDVLEPGPNLKQEADARSTVIYQAKLLTGTFFRDLQKRRVRKSRKQVTELVAPDEKKIITIATSIAPRDLEDQRQAISSWINMGFRVVSINAPEEISIVQQHFPDVEFIVPAKTAKSKYGKPFVYFDDILDYFDQQDIRICGIVNSDIHFRNSTLYDLVAKEAINSLVYGSRVEINSLHDQTGIMDIWGFDYFFFDKHFIPYFPKEDFCLGIPWWDFWVPLILLGYKLPVKKLVTPHAYHVTHQRRYDDETLYTLAYTLAKYISPPFVLTDQTMPHYGMFLRMLMKKCSLEIALNTPQ